MHFAVVEADGDLAAGDAANALASFGIYSVEFSVDVRDCAATVTTWSGNNATAHIYTTHTGTSPPESGLDFRNTVTVHSYEAFADTPSHDGSDFSLTVICP